MKHISLLARLVFASSLIVMFVAVPFMRAPLVYAAAQCSDNTDNDSDGKIDHDGGVAGGTPDPDCTDASDDSEAGTTGASTTDLSFDIHNPLQSDIDTLPEFINKLIEIFLMIGTPIVALAIIYSGFLFVIARGNPEKIESAKKTLGYTLLGAAILLGAFVISTAIQDTITGISSEATAPPAGGAAGGGLPGGPGGGGS